MNEAVTRRVAPDVARPGAVRDERPIRSLVVTNMYPTPGGPVTGTFVADQVGSLQRIGVEVELLHLARATSGRSVYRDLRREVARLVETVQPDIVHVMYGGIMADVVTRAIHDRPVVVSFCGSDLHGGKARGLRDAVTLQLGVLASKRAARRAAGVIVKSRNLMDALPRSLDRSRVWLLPNGVDTERFAPIAGEACRKALGWDDTRAHVLFPAPTDRPEKRYELAVAAMEQLERDGTQAELHVLAGVAHDDVPLWLNAADAVVLTSVEEGSPNVVKEALACNVPIVSVDVGDVRERIGDVEGCFVTGADAAELARALRDATRRDNSIDGRGRIEELSLERVAGRLLEIYETLRERVPSAPSR